VSEGSRLDPLFELTQRHPRRVFPLLAGLIVAAIGATIALWQLDQPADPVLPVEFRLIQPELTGLPVKIDHIRSCSCWHGPRAQAQRKYKFRVVNETDRQLNIGGGERSAIRLIVAYPHARQPRLTVPAFGDNERSLQLPSPGDVEIPITSKIDRQRPTRLPGTNEFFGVPKGFTVWALAPTPNKLAEFLEVLPFTGPQGEISANYSYPTVVDKTHLLPGEEYEGDRLGHGTWTFYIPIPPRVARELKGDGRVAPVFSRGYYEQFVIFVGIAALAPESHGRGRLLGFGPAPSDNAFAEPGDL
jgi:hypothetical protein